MPSEDVKTLKGDGIVLLEDLLPREQLRSMQEAFAARLRRLRFNDVDGYEKTELYRDMVQDVLTLDRGFVDLALHPRVLMILREYLGPPFRLTEAKGWRSLATRRSFHGWHGDAWYDQRASEGIPREVKLAYYLSDVRSGEFQYVRGTHRQHHPRMWFDSEVAQFGEGRIVRATGPAGTAVLFDTSGIHRQGEPILEDRDAVFLNYHDPRVPIQEEDAVYYRYHPLLLNAAFLGSLSEEHRRILGFGDKSQYLHAFERPARFPILAGFFQVAWNLRLRADDVIQHVRARWTSGRRPTAGELQRPGS
jgi:hypothetical protein